MGKKCALAVFFILAALLIGAQESGTTEGASSPEATDAATAPASGLLPVPSLPIEAPQSLLSLQLGDSDVELIAKGYWEVGVTGSGAVGFGANSGVSAPTFLFQQTPDLYLSLILMKKWFVEVTLSADGTEEGYAAGYRGGEGDYLKEVRIGNMDVSFPELPYISLGSGISSSFGVSAYGQNDRGSTHFMLRYDQARRVSQSWIGDREVSETDFNPSDFAHGRFFVLPNTNVTNVELYIENSSGTLTGDDGNSYRKMATDEYSVSSVTGRVDLDDEVDEDRRLLVYYVGLDTSSVDTSAAPFYDKPLEYVTVDSVSALLLYEEGEQEGFQIANRYTVPSSTTIASATAYVEDTSSGQKDAAYTVTILSSGYVQITKGDVFDPQVLDYSHPFLNEGMDWVYNPDATTEADDDEEVTEAAPAYSKIVVLASYGTSGDLVLDDDDILSGSIEVTRNGVRDYDFSYNANTHTVTLERDPGLSETITISYLLKSSESSAGILSGGLGAIFNLSPAWKAWTAFGMQWGVPGTGYSESGEENTGNLTLTAGIKGGTPQAKQGEAPPPEMLEVEAALAASYNREDAAGFYRVAGMEDASSWTSPFKETSNWPNASGDDVEQYTTSDDELGTLFPDIYGRFHSDSSTQEVLEFEFTSNTNGTEAEVVRYVDTINAGNYQTFAFFARADITSYYTASDSAFLTVALYTGTSAAVSVKIPFTYLDTEWRCFLLRYGGVPHLYYLTEEDGTEHRIDDNIDVVIDADPSLSAGEVVISVEGVDEGTVYVDELYFEDPVGEFSLSGRGKFGWSRTGTIASIAGRPILSDPRVVARLSGTVSEDTAAAGYLDGSMGVGPFRVSLSGQQGISDGVFSDGAFGHGVELPLKNLQIKDTFDYSLYSGKFDRYDKLAFNAGSFSLKIEQTASYGSEALEQEWKVNLSAGSFFSLTGILENQAASELDLPSDYGNAWLQAYRYILPALESDSTSRATDLKGYFKVSDGLLFFSAGSALLNAASDEPDSTSEGDLRFGWAIPAGKGSIEPYYKRTWSFETVASNRSFVDDWSFWAESFGEADYLYRSIPFLELWDDTTVDRFTAAVAGSTAAEYYPEAGISLSRKYGSKWTDLLVPSRGTIAVRRELESSLDTVTDALVGEITTRAAAINLFGSRGVYRLSNLYAVDEYSQKLSLETALYREDGEVLTAFSHTLLASFYTSREDSLVAENRLTVAETRDGTTWSEQLSLTLTEKPRVTWLGNLAIKYIDKPQKKMEGQADSGKPSIVSGYMETLRGAPRNLTEVWQATALLKRPYAYTDQYNFELTQSYVSKLVTPGKLTVSASIEPYQELIIKSGLYYWTFGMDLSFSMKIIF